LSTEKTIKPPLWEPVQNETLSGSIVTQIRNAVLSETLHAGQFLGSEAALAKQFGVSRMAARDALRTLEGLGIIEIRMGAKGGVWIAPGNPDHLGGALAIHLKLIGVTPSEVFDAQMALEITAAELAAQRRTDADVQQLRERLNELETSKNDLERFARVSMQFHDGLVKAAHSRILLVEFRALSHVLQPVLLPNLTADSAERIIQRHRMLLSAIEARDGASAASIMRERLTYQRDKTLAQSQSAVIPTP